MNHVSALVAGGVLPAAQGNQLISLAEGLGSSIVCDF